MATLNNINPEEMPVFPADFPERLEWLRDAMGLTWNSMASTLGVDIRQLSRWRNQTTTPSGSGMLAILRLAKGIPGGEEKMLAGDKNYRKMEA